MLKKNFHNNKLLKLLVKAFSCTLVILTINSCSDQGCIDADDFGEYESQTIEVFSNNLQESCFFDHAKELTDSSQGSGIKNCLTSGLVSVSDENGIEQVSLTGCMEFTDIKFINLCISHCIDVCNSNSSRFTNSAEPDWVSTDRKISGKNIGVTIRPGSEISVRAIGTVVLGSTLNFPDSYIQANEAKPHSRDINWEDRFFDAKRNQSLFIKFSGTWKANNSANSVVGAGQSRITGTQADSKIYNGAKTTVIYSIPHPDGYDFNLNAGDELQGSIDVPLLPDPRVWQCQYSAAGNNLESTCSNSASGYTGVGYSNVNNSVAAATFPVSSSVRTVELSKYGGMIRWNNDELLPESYDPFAINSVVCNGSTGSCSGVDNVNPNQGRVLGTQVENGAVEISNNQDSAYRISFKSLSGDNGCDTTFNNISIASQDDAIIDIINNFAVSSSGWTSEDISLEPRQKLIISQNSQLHPNGISCGALIGVRFHKYHDINITQSGFVKFTMLKGSGNCRIRGRIINPNGSHFDVDSSYTADFYEYGNFINQAGNGDPLESIIVTASQPFAQLTWSDEFFVRKGQVIRFAPESWNGTWSADNSLQRQCGIGMAMSIEPRPALLCRGATTELVNNPSCIALFNGNQIVGCQAVAEECNNTGNAYCPSQACQAPIICSGNGDESNNFTRTGCSLGNIDPSCTFGAGFNSSTCLECDNLRLNNASSSFKVELDNIQQCYDLENYLGKVANIPIATSSNRQEVEDFITNITKSKGATTLQTFNGSYGNLSNFNVTPDNDSINNNAIYQLKTPITFINSGRVRFFVIDNKDFNAPDGFNSYEDNSNSGSSYSGSNGIKINITGTLEYNNGTWMQARLCQETNSGSSICSNSNPIALNAQPQIIEITPPNINTAPGSSPALTANYRFNDYGTLIRTSALGAEGDCTAAITGIENFSGANYYCHTHQYFNKEQLKGMSEAEKAIANDEVSRLRLSFKILDPELSNCDITSVGANDGVRSDNPFYDATIPENLGQICQPGELPGDGSEVGASCQKQYYCANKYANNHGKYLVNVRVKNPSDGQISNIIGEVINPIVEIMDGKKDNPLTAEDETTVGQAERVYKLLISDSRYQAILNIALVTMFTFYGFGYLIGVVEMNNTDLIMRIVKIGIIYLFVSETGWEFFDKIVVKLFKNSTDYLAFMMASSFDDSPELKNAISNGEFYDKSVLFSSVDKVFTLFFSSTVQKKVSALLFASIFGWAYLFIIYSSFMLYVYAVSNAVLLYLTAQVFISILFVLGPIFLIFTLFNQTKEMFDNWLKQLIGFSLQQIFLLTTLAFFNMLMYEVIKMSLGYKICWDEVWTINIITRITLLSFWTIASLPPRVNQHSEIANIGNPEGIPSLFTILFIWVIASLMHKFINFMTDLAAGISGGLKASSLGSGVTSMAAQMRKSAGAAYNRLSERIGLSTPLRKLDKALFDSGKLAEEARGKAKKQNSIDQNNKAAMQKAGEIAISDYKINNIKDLMLLNEDQQREKLKEVRDKAENAEGAKLGLDSATISKLRTSKGSTHVGSNAIGKIRHEVGQVLSKGGTRFTSLDDRKIDITLSHSEGQKALKNMNQNERKDFIQSVKDGRIHVENSKLNKLKHNKARVAGAVITVGASEAGVAVKNKIQGWNQNRKLRAKASRELENSGMIDRTRGKELGFGFGRTKADKALISERSKQIKESSRRNKTANLDSVAELERESNYIDKQKQMSDSNASMSTKAKEGFKRVFRLDNLNTQTKINYRGNVINKLRSDLGTSFDNKRALESQLNSAQNDYDAALEPVKEDLNTIKKLESLPQLSQEQKQKLAQSKARVNAAKNSEAAKNAVAAMHQYQSQINILEEQEEEMQQQLNELEKPPVASRFSRAKNWISNKFSKKQNNSNDTDE